MKNKLNVILTIIAFLISFALVSAALPAEPKPIQEEEKNIVIETAEKPLEPIAEIPVPPLEVFEENTNFIPIFNECEYPAATEAWYYMKEKGWSDEVCAGIMGNMMEECGGGTLNLRWDAVGDSGTSYGLCQWHNGRKNNLLKNYGNTIEAQIDFLEYELGNPNDYFSNPNDYKQVAYEFCIKFERPSNKEQKGLNRKALAQTAFEYFVGK